MLSAKLIANILCRASERDSAGPRIVSRRRPAGPRLAGSKSAARPAATIGRKRVSRSPGTRNTTARRQNARLSMQLNPLIERAGFDREPTGCFKCQANLKGPRKDNLAIATP